MGKLRVPHPCYRRAKAWLRTTSKARLRAMKRRMGIMG